jgi:hypothetical protein
MSHRTEPVSELDVLVDRLEREARAGCWCSNNRKPCEFHEGYEAGLGVFAQALEHVGWDLDGSHYGRDAWFAKGERPVPLYRLGEQP